MSLSAHLWIIRVITAAMLCVFLSVVWYVDPDVSGVVGVLFFFGSLFLFLSGACTLFLLWLRKKSLGEWRALDSVSVSVRQGFLLAVLTTSLLLLEIYGMLVWWSGLILTGGIFFIELFYLIKSSDK